ncbi:MAG: diadenylate cyclase CdaA [Sphaerochaetaceae bacterium]|nr:diadenylate cyclase CdaA [Sphaerochaetaceae bacterium]
MLNFDSQTVTIIKAIFQISFLAWLFYQFYMALDRSKIQRMVRMIAAAFAVFTGAYILRLEVLVTLFEYLAIPYVVFLCLIFQSELRRSFSSGWLGKSRLKLTTLASITDQIDTVLSACINLKNKRRGALIVFPRRDTLTSVINSGTTLDAQLSSQLILTVFDHDTPLHDGAIVINGDKIVAAGCYLPLSEQTDIKKTFGTRHRAALGICEETDAVVIVVSEETGALTLAYNAGLYYDLSRDQIKRILPALFSNQELKEDDIKEDVSDEQK